MSSTPVWWCFCQPIYSANRRNWRSRWIAFQWLKQILGPWGPGRTVTYKVATIRHRCLVCGRATHLEITVSSYPGKLNFTTKIVCPLPPPPDCSALDSRMPQSGGPTRAVTLLMLGCACNCLSPWCWRMSTHEVLILVEWGNLLPKIWLFYASFIVLLTYIQVVWRFV